MMDKGDLFILAFQPLDAIISQCPVRGIHRIT
jgi:hypothetical protein